MAWDSDTGDKFIAPDNDASAAQAASTAWVVPLSFFLFSTILCSVYTYGVHGARLFTVQCGQGDCNHLLHFSCWLVLPYWSSFLCYLRLNLPIFQYFQIVFTLGPFNVAGWHSVWIRLLLWSTVYFAFVTITWWFARQYRQSVKYTSCTFKLICILCNSFLSTL
jgi:hypothetical protein